MHVQHGTSVLVTDGRKALLLKNEGDAKYPDLRLVQKWEQQLEAAHDLGSDSPGRSFSSQAGGSRRSSYEEGDLHEAAEVRFVSELAEFLNDQFLAKAVEELIIVAPPRTLGEIRLHLRDPLPSIVVAEIRKDLVKHPIPEIERLLAAYSEPA